MRRVVTGALIGLAIVGYLVKDTMEAGRATRKAVALCETNLPRNENCLVLAVPRSFMNGLSEELENTSRGGYPLLFDPPVPGADSELR